MTGTIDAPAPPPPPEPTSTGGGLLSRLRSPWGLGGVAVTLAVVLVGVGLLRPPGSIDVFLEPAGAVGADPFLTIDGVGDLRSGADLFLTLPGGITIRVGTEPGLYGGSGDELECDPELIGDFLADEPEKAAAWAGALGITVADIPSYLDTLTPVVLLADTWVTNHGYKDGQATPFQAVLQAGTMVLIDDEGVPRVRCKCGNPLTEPDVPDDLDRVDFQGPPWTAFDEEQILVIEGGDPVDAFTIVRLDDGRLVARPVGTTGDEDILIDDEGNWIAELDLDLPAEAAPDDGPFPLPTENSAGIDVEYAFDGPCSRRNDELVLDGSGRCEVSATTPAESPWGALERDALVVIGLRGQSVNVAAFGDVIVGEDPMPIGGLADSGLPVRYSVSGACTLDDGAVAATEVGECELSAAQDGDDTWAPAEPVVVRFAAIEGEPRPDDELVVIAPEAIRLSDPPIPIEAPSGTDRPVEFFTSGGCQVDDSSVLASRLGACTIVAVQAGDATTRRSVARAELEVLRGLQRIRLDLLPEFGAPGDPAIPLPATSSSGVEVSYQTDGPCEIGDDGLVLTDEGECTITGEAPGDSQQEPARETWTITSDDGVAERQAQSIRFGSPGSLTFGGGAVRLQAAATSGLPVTLTVTGGSCRLSGTSLSPGNAGTCTVTASQNGNAEWEPAAPQSVRISVRKARPSVQISASGSMQATGSQPVGASVSGGPGASLSVISGPCSLSGGGLVANGVGTCTLRASAPGDGNHEPASIDFSIQISPAAQSISWGSIPSSLVIGSQATVSASASSGLPVAISAGPAGVCTLGGGALSAVGAGSCTVTASQAGDGIYAAAPSISATVTITKQPHTVEVSVSTGTMRIGDQATFKVASSAGFQPSVSTSGAGCVYDGNLVVAVAVGTCTISASHPGDATYEAASDSRTIEVLRRADSISLRVGDFTFGSGGQVVARSASGLPVGIVASGSCRYTDGILLADTLGACTITATTAGDGTWEPASASATINVNPATPALRISAPSSVWYDDVIPYSVATNAPNVSVSGAGECEPISLGVSGSFQTTWGGACTITVTVGGGVYANRTESVTVTIRILL